VKVGEGDGDGVFLSLLTYAFVIVLCSLKQMVFNLIKQKNWSFPPFAMQYVENTRQGCSSDEDSSLILLRPC